MSFASLISVIMPAYNCENFVKKAIDSVLNQDYKNFELLIADDCSTDKTKTIINSYSDQRIKTFHNLTNQGYLKASNLLLKQAQGEFIVFQDADDLASFNRFSILSDFLIKNEDVYAVGSNVITIDEDDREISRTDFPITHKQILENFCKYRTTIVGSALMFRKEILKTIGFYNEYFNRIGWEDFYWFSLIILKHKVSNVKDCLYYYRSNQNSVSNKNKSFKSIAGFNVIVYYLNERLAGRTEDIENKNWLKADEMMARFYIKDQISNKKKLSLQDIFNISSNYFTAIKLWLFYIKNLNQVRNISTNSK